ncbi:MAG: hypothetical protein WCH40_05835 [Verrucomicrobiales bacterium]
MTGQIVIPDDSPFTPEQRVWLSGYLEKLLAGGSPAPTAGPTVPVTILFGSQTGNAEGLGKKLATAFIAQRKKDKRYLRDVY